MDTRTRQRGLDRGMERIACCGPVQSGLRAATGARPGSLTASWVSVWMRLPLPPGNCCRSTGGLGPDDVAKERAKRGSPRPSGHESVAGCIGDNWTSVVPQSGHTAVCSRPNPDKPEPRSRTVATTGTCLDLSGCGRPLKPPWILAPKHIAKKSCQNEKRFHRSGTMEFQDARFDWRNAFFPQRPD